ncbi:MAG TPA: DUF4361 domain-containing protein [Bacteroidales bacterium]|nr:DUF4361 domain-containing protein [Bacteroidales bacterium]HPS61882.1 DUF4361 domain-containing protein [Bacteroidales bacterium]
MKRITNISRWALMMGAVLLVVAACNKNEDLVTKDAQEGGLIVPVTTNFAYKLANTPQVDVTLKAPVGPAIQKIEVYNSYTSADVADTAHPVSNEVLIKTITPGSGDITFTLTYADLKNGLTLGTTPLPDDETKLGIGSNWTLRYVSYMAADGRKVINNNKTVISVANIYAGLYQCTGVFHHPTAGDRTINEEKYLTAISAYEVTSTTGDLGADYPLKIIVNPTDNTCTVEKLDPNPYDLFMQAGKDSHYDPATGKFYLWYYYVGSTGNRVIDEEYTPKP